MKAKAMQTGRRKLLKGAILGAGLVGLRCLATGLPKSWLLGDRIAHAADLSPQFLILATSGQGDPLNANAPGSFVQGAENSPIAELIDFRTAGPGTLPRLFSQVNWVLCTEDSSTMLSETVCARLPVVGVAPKVHAFKDDEREYRAYMRDQGWCRFLPIAELTPDRLKAVLAEIRPLAENHLDRLARELEERVPELFR